MAINLPSVTLGMVKEQITTSGPVWTTQSRRTTHEVSRPLLTADGTMRLKSARKNSQGVITEPGNMVIYVAGYPAIMGRQPLYFKDPELARRARISSQAAAESKKTRMPATASG
ncbi:MAG: type IV secretory system conjugative DNA transfer family protein [Verrucomicrobia bacterium]|nr:type IV secretory system conjugative DNA transfer family protein [Verrucomicrobiota bacterium]